MTRYASQVVRGRIVAGRAVRLACARHLADLDRRGTPAFPYRWEPRRVARLLEFFQLLSLDDVDARGAFKPFNLPRWLVFCFGSLVGWVDASGHRRFKQAFIETGKGSGKTPSLAGFGLHGLVGENRNAVEIYSLGVNADQANYLYGFAKRMCQRSEELCDLLEVGEYNTAWIDRNSFFRPLTSEGRSLDNKKVFLALIDELHEHPTAVIPEKMRLGIKNQEDALVIEITNSGHDKTSVCWRHHELSLNVLEGTLVDEEWFAYVCQLDPCEGCRAKGASQPNDGCPDCDSWTDERVWPKVAPALDEVTTRAYLRGCVRQAQNQPDMLARVKRLNFCLWTQAHTIWIPTDQWDACRVDAVPVSRTVPCAAAFDMSMKVDLCGCVLAQRFDDPPEVRTETVELAENENGQTVLKQWHVRYRIALSAFAWLPADTLLERVKKDRIPFDVWERTKLLRVTPGPVIDHHQIYDDFVQEIAPCFNPQLVGYDPYNATEFAVDLRDRAKLNVTELGQGRKLSEYIKLFHALVRLKRILHDGNPVFGWCVANAEPKTDRYENMWLEKPSPTKRIDLAIAAVMALSLVVLLPAPGPKRRRPAKVWTPAGFMPALPNATHDPTTREADA